MTAATESRLQKLTHLSREDFLQNLAGTHTCPANDTGSKTGPLLYIVDNVCKAPNLDIPFQTAENIICAAAFARALELPLHHHLTIRWPNESPEYHECLLRRISEWQTNNIGQAAFVWVREAVPGHHSHILLHLARGKGRQFRRLLNKWLKNEFGVTHLQAGTAKCRNLWSSGDPDQNFRRRLRYILKGAGDQTREFFGAVNKGSQGYIIGKRAGVAQSLGVAARREAGAVQLCGLRKCSNEMINAAEFIRRQKDAAISRHGKDQ